MRTCATPRSPTSGFTTWTRAREVSLRRTTTLPMFGKDSATDLGGRWPVPVPWLLPGPSVGARRNLQQRRSHAGHHACVHAVVCGVKLADLSITTEPRKLTAPQSRPACIFTTAAVPGRSATLDVRVASSIAAAARGDAAQAAFDRKLSHYRNEIGALRPDCHSNASVCSRHRLQLEWAADVGEITPSQVEA